MLNYGDYISSKAWNRRKWAFYNKAGKICAACASKTNIIVHHLSYEHLGKEPDEDLVVLCRDCHNELHLRYGSMRWDLKEKSYEFIQEKQELAEVALLSWI